MVLWYFAFTLFVSASLLFLVQPMIGKMILPRLGGTPAVWNTCMVFFQAMLLVGYFYTHSVSTWLSRRQQLILQSIVVLLPALVLPFTLGDWTPPTEANPIYSVLWLLLGMVGLPFFVVATSAPLLQKWFAATPHPSAKDPYFLYGASNLGSMLALLSYPLLVEPLLAVEEQAWFWSLGYGLLAILVIGCAAIVWRVPESSSLVRLGDHEASPVIRTPGNIAPAAAENVDEAVRAGPPASPSAASPSAAQSPANGERTAGRPSWPRRLRWIGLAAAPSSLMLGLTTYLTTDVAAIPFFWVIPLALYLLTFILVFARWPVVWTGFPHFVVLFLQPVVVGALVLVMSANWGFPSISMDFGLHVLAFFLTTLMCHGEMAKDRPSTRYLTDFYLCMSIGGVLGGMFNALFAPMAFSWGIIEYPLAMVLACLLRPSILVDDTFIPGDSSSQGTTTLGRVLDFVIPGVIGLATLAAVTFSFGLSSESLLAKVKLSVIIVAIVLLAARPIRFGLSLAAFLLIINLHERNAYQYVFEDRGFFGFVRVREDTIDFYDKAGNVIERRACYLLVHGGINHGQQQLGFVYNRDGEIVQRPGLRRDTITYFHPTGGIGQLFTEFSWPDARLPASLVGLGALGPTSPYALLVDTQSEPAYAVVGLGIGTLAAFAKPYQHATFYEIDPIVKRLSDPPGKQKAIFTYIEDARERGAKVDIVLGDGRLMLKDNKNLENYYHVLVLDAFASDAIPVHLLTKEAVEMYLERLAEGGILIFNTTNRYVDITGVLADIANDLDLKCYAFGDYGSDDDPTKFASDWVVMQRKTKNPRNGGPAIEDRVETAVVENEITWRPPTPLGGPVWTDRYSNLLRVLRWR